MALPEARLQQLIERKNASEALSWCEAHGYSEGWAIIDGAMVIYDIDNPPVWLAPILDLQDDDGNTDHIVAGVTPMRKPREGEYGVGFEPTLVPIEERATAEA
jgi:hypothetical protein